MKKAIVSLIIQGRDKTGGLLKKVTGRVKKLTQSIFSMRTIIGALATGAIARGISSLFKLGSAAEETASKFNTVFGDSADSVQHFADTFGQLAGLSRTQGQEITATTGAIVRGFGFGEEAAADFAKEIVRLGADLASFNDLQGGTEQGVRIIQSGLTGEMERLKRLGIVLKSVEVDQRALINTNKSSVSQLNESERAMARFQLITEKAGVAVGDLERTQDSMANVSRRLGAVLRTIKEDMGTMFLESFKLIGGFTETAEKVTTFSQKLQENRNQIVAWMAAAINAAKFVGSAFLTGFRIIFNAIQILTNSLASLAAAAFAAVRGRFSEAKNLLTDPRERALLDTAPRATEGEH